MAIKEKQVNRACNVPRDVLERGRKL